MSMTLECRKRASDTARRYMTTACNPTHNSASFKLKGSIEWVMPGA
jgi:hypothetical protein